MGNFRNGKGNERYYLKTVNYMLKNEYNTAEEVASAKKLAANFGQFHVRNDIYSLGAPK